MDTSNTAAVDVPNLKLARVGNNRERKRGGAGWFGARGAGSAFSGAAGGSGAGVFGTSMSLAKLLTVLLVSGGLSAGAWMVGHSLANGSASVKPSNTKLFADKDSGKYADTSGVIKGKNEIPNSLGYVNNDGLTDEQRAAKKAAEEEAARKAAADAQAKADADAKAKADADKAAADAAAKATPASPQGAPDMMKKALAGGNKFGSMSSSFGGGGGGLSGGAGLSGGINSKFGAMNSMKGQNGALAGFGAGSKPTMSAAQKGTPTPKSGLKGFAAQQLGNAFGATRSALASGQTESAAAGAGAPFDNNPAAGSVISGPGVSNGAQTGTADSAGSPNSSSGGGTSGPIGDGGAACSQSGYEPDINGNCQPVASPTMVNAAPYQGLIDTVMVLMGIVALLSLFQMYLASNPVGWIGVETVGRIIGALGAVIALMGMSIIAMSHDIMIGGIITAIGGFIAGVAFVPGILGSTETFTTDAAATLISSAVGMMAASSAKTSSLT